LKKSAREANTLPPQACYHAGYRRDGRVA